MFRFLLAGKLIIKAFDDIRLRYLPALGVKQIILDEAYEGLLEYYPRKGYVIIDVSAFVGLYTARASRLVGLRGLRSGLAREVVLEIHSSVAKKANELLLNSYANTDTK